VIAGKTPKEVLFDHDPVSGTAYYLSLCVFALMPWYLGRIGRPYLRPEHPRQRA
jgi:hypothetical protein